MEDSFTQSDGSTTLNFASCRNAIEKLKEFEIDRNNESFWRCKHTKSWCLQSLYSSSKIDEDLVRNIHTLLLTTSYCCLPIDLENMQCCGTLLWELSHYYTSSSIGGVPSFTLILRLTCMCHPWRLSCASGIHLWRCGPNNEQACPTVAELSSDLQSRGMIRWPSSISKIDVKKIVKIWWQLVHTPQCVQSIVTVNDIENFASLVCVCFFLRLHAIGSRITHNRHFEHLSALLCSKHSTENSNAGGGEVSAVELMKFLHHAI